MDPYDLKDKFKLKAEGKCPFCKKDMTKDPYFENEISQKEFKISGLCQNCQDKFFD